MTHTIEVTRPLDPKVLARAMRKCRRSGPRTATFRLAYVLSLVHCGLIGIGGIALAHIVLRLAGASPHQQGVGTPFLGVVLGIFVVRGFEILRRLYMAEQCLKTPILSTLQRFDFSVEGFEMVSQSGLCRYDWSTVDRVIEDSGDLFCYTGPGVVVVPTSDLSTDERRALLKDIAVWRQQEESA